VGTGFPSGFATENKMSHVIHRETIPARAPWSRVIRAGEALRIIDTHGQQAVDFLCYNAADPAERYHAPNTLKAAGTILLTRGHTLYSDKARALFLIEEDTFGGHDTIGGCCSKPSNDMLYGVANEGCRENFLAALRTARAGLEGRRAQRQLVHDRAGGGGGRCGHCAGLVEAGRLRHIAGADGRTCRHLQLPAGAQPVQQLQPDADRG
jgi:uncharacterized protein YcgI (DUF1989 family)